MSTVHDVAGFMSIVVEMIDNTTGSLEGRNVFPFDHRSQWSQAGSAPDATRMKISAVCRSGVMSIPTGLQTVSIADSVDPFGSLGANVPNVDPEGMLLKILAFFNHSAADGTGNSVYLHPGTNGLIGWVVTRVNKALAGATDAIVLPPQGIALHTFPQGTAAANDGVDDEIVIEGTGLPNGIEMFYALG